MLKVWVPWCPVAHDVPACKLEGFDTNTAKKAKIPLRVTV